MGELVHQLGINPLLLIAQVVNFLILFGLLWKFLYKPLLRVMRERRERIEKSLREAERVEQDLASSREQAQEMVGNASNRAAEIIAAGQKEAEAKRHDRLKTAEAEATQVFKRAEESIKEERVQLQRELSAQAANLVGLATERVIKKSLDEKSQRKLIADALEELS